MVSLGTAGAGAEDRLKALNMVLPQVPKPLGAYVESMQTGNLLFLTGMLPLVDGKARHIGRVGAELDLEAGRDACRIAGLNALATAREALGSLDRVARVVRLGVFIATAPDFIDHPTLADGASELIEDIFGKERTSTRLVLGVVSLPLGLPVELELIFEVKME